MIAPHQACTTHALSSGHESVPCKAQRPRSVRKQNFGELACPLGPGVGKGKGDSTVEKKQNFGHDVANGGVYKVVAVHEVAEVSEREQRKSVVPDIHLCEAGFGPRSLVRVPAPKFHGAQRQLEQGVRDVEQFGMVHLRGGEGCSGHRGFRVAPFDFEFRYLLSHTLPMPCPAG